VPGYLSPRWGFFSSGAFSHGSRHGLQPFAALRLAGQLGGRLAALHRRIVKDQCFIFSIRQYQLGYLEQR